MSAPDKDLGTEAAVALVAAGVRRFRTRAEVIVPLQRVCASLTIMTLIILGAFCIFGGIAVDAALLAYGKNTDSLVLGSKILLELVQVLTIALVLCIAVVMLCPLAAPFLGQFAIRSMRRDALTENAMRLLVKDDPLVSYCNPMDDISFYAVFGTTLTPVKLEDATWVDTVCAKALAHTPQEKARALATALVLECDALTAPLLWKR
jgi:hypothetical protein